MVATASDPTELQRLHGTIAAAWPKHKKSLETAVAGLDGGQLRQLDDLADKIGLLLGGKWSRHIDDYRWLCKMSIEESVHFLRTGKYRHDSFAEVSRAVYENEALMTRYVNSLLVSQVCWHNHIQTFLYYLNEFLPLVSSDADFLEVGPGHGIFIHYAARHIAAGRTTGWDISPASLAATRNSLQKLDQADKTELMIQDVDAIDVDRHARRFDAVLINEVLEHLEQPGVALANLQQVMKPGGRIFIGFPINSPMIDHIYLLKTPEAVRDLVQGAGFTVESMHLFPTTGKRVEQSLKNSFPISCAVIGRV